MLRCKYYHPNWCFKLGHSSCASKDCGMKGSSKEDRAKAEKEIRDDLLKKPPSNEDGTSRVVTGAPTASTTGTTDTSTSTMMPECAICLEPYQQGDWVRTIPCFHTFHRQCIDSWLANKAECPICKHTAIA